MPPGFSSENLLDESEFQYSERQRNSQTSSTRETCPSRYFFDSFNNLINIIEFSSGWVIQMGELRYIPTACTSILNIALNLVRAGYIQFYYKMPKNSQSLLAILQVKNAHCQNYGLVSIFQIFSIFYDFQGCEEYALSSNESTNLRLGIRQSTF